MVFSFRQFWLLILIGFSIPVASFSAACPSGTYPSGTTCRRDCFAGSSSSTGCLGGNGSGVQTRVCSANGQWGPYGSCSLNRCNSGFYLNAGACVRDCVAGNSSSQNCAIASGIGIQSRTCAANGQWGGFGICSVQNCNPGFYLSGRTCRQDCAPNASSSQACPIPFGTGTQSRTCSANGQWRAFGSCTLVSCAPGFYSSGGTCKRDCVASQSGSQACGVANGTGIQSKTCSANGQWGTFGSCTATRCSAGFYLSGGACVRDCAAGNWSSQNCAIANGVGIQSRTCAANGQWGAFGSCSVQSCNAGFYPSGRTCRQDCAPSASSSQACSISFGTGTQSRTCSANGQWGAFGSCAVASCRSGFYSSGGICKRDCIASQVGSQSCPISNGIGTQSRTCSANGQWGDFGSCTANRCSSGYYLSGGSCIQNCAPRQVGTQACELPGAVGIQSRTCMASGQWGAFGTCTVSSCNRGFYLSGGVCKQDCEPGATSSQACPAANGTGTQSRTCSAIGQWGSYGFCMVQSCNPGFYSTGLNCTRECTSGQTSSQNCNVANGSGTQSRSCLADGHWGEFGSCAISRCSPGFYSSGSGCIQDCSPRETSSQACSTPDGNGTQTRTCSATGQWGAFGSCSATTCNSGFYVSNGACASDGIEILTQPTGQAAISGAATFSVQAQTRSRLPVSVQWEAKAPNQTEWKQIEGATGKTLPLRNLKSANHNTMYRAVFSRPEFTSVTSNEVNLTVSNTVQMLSQPSDNQLANNGSVKFEFTARSAKKITVQWQRKVGEEDFSDIPGETKVTSGIIGLWRSSYTIEDVSKEPVGSKYRAQLSMDALKFYTNPVGFRVLSTPKIDEISPKQGDPSTLVTIKGSNFDGVMGISIGGVQVAYSSVKSSQEITIVPSVNAVAGAITVTNAAGIGTSRDSFRFNNPFCSPRINKDKALLINSPLVVDDPERTQFNSEDSSRGGWSFSGLMARIAPANSDVEEFVHSWLNLWMTPSLVNGFQVPGRDISGILESWPKNNAGKLDLSKAPFRLLAISNRLDLRSAVATDKKAGSLIFVFGLFDQTPGENYGRPLKMTVVMEFDLRTEVSNLMDWTLKWYRLGAFQSFDEAFKKKLEQLTSAVTSQNALIPKTNHSAFSVIRTSDNEFGNATEFREFSLNADGRLIQSPLKQTPDVSFNSERKLELVQWINDNLSAVGSNKFEVKKEFLAGSASAPASSWLADTDLSPRVRSNFAMATCTGCHQSETRNSGIHIANRKENEASQISPFLTNDLLVREFEFKTMLMEMFCGQ